MKRSMFFATLGVAALLFGLTGCGNSKYSPTIKYGLRKDPVLKASAAKDLGEETYVPDRPGLLPIMKLDDMENPAHPYHAKRKSIDDKILRDPAKIPEAVRKDIEATLDALFGTPASPKVDLKALTYKDIANVAESRKLRNPDVVRSLEKTLAEMQADETLSEAKLAQASARYRVHCVHCHGVPGDGRGPTARWINPHPRDFRAGLFKFQSVDQTGGAMPPSRTDLMRTLRQGIEGTAMPSFALLKDDELQLLISYVIHLSIRGNAEQTLILESFGLDKDQLVFDSSEGSVQEKIKSLTGRFARDWWEANKPGAALKVKDVPAIDPNDVESLKASVKRGQMLFLGEPSAEFKKEAYARLFTRALNAAQEAAVQKAIKAAEDKASEAAVAKALEEAEAKAKAAKKELTNDEMQKISDKVTAAVKESLKKEHPAIRASASKEFPELEKAIGAKVEADANSLLTGAKCVSCHTDYGRQARFKFDDWGTLVRPNNLVRGELRGGKRPVDIYYRIHSGIPGSAMTPFGKTFEGNESYIWDLVNFVTVLPYPAMRDRLGLKLD